MTKIFYNKDISIALNKSIEMNLPTLLIGDTGTGKTSFIYDIAAKHKKEIIRLNLTGQTGVDELIGKYLANKEGTYWIDGLLVQAMKKGYWIVLDEINMALPEILSKLHSLLDDDRKIVLNEKEGEIIKPHEDFRFFATMNPCEEYAGTKELNKAFLSRFPIILQVDYSPEEVKIIQDRTGVNFDLASQLVLIAREIRKNKQEDKVSYSCSTRDLIYCASLIKKGVERNLAIEISMLNKAPADERVVLGKLTGLVTGDEINIDDVKYESVADLIEKAKDFHKKNQEKEEKVKELTKCIDRIEEKRKEEIKQIEEIGKLFEDITKEYKLCKDQKDKSEKALKTQKEKILAARNKVYSLTDKLKRTQKKVDSLTAYNLKK